MSDVSRFKAEYSALLSRYLARPEEATLVKAYELGREALADGIGMLELIEAHGSAVFARMRTRTTAAQAAAIADRAHSLLAECVAPYEIAYRGFREANASLRAQREDSEFLSTAIWKASTTLNLEDCASTLVRHALTRLASACALEVRTGPDGSSRHTIFWGKVGSKGAEYGTHESGDPSCLLDGMETEDCEPVPGLPGRWIVHHLKGHRGSYGAMAFRKDGRSEEVRRLTGSFVERAVTVLENAILYRQSQQALVAREDMINVVSHDLKNPLTSIYLNSQIIAKGLQESWDPNALDAPVRRIGMSATRMRSLIEDILDLARVDTGRFVFHPRDCKVGHMLEEAVQMMAPIAEQAKVRLVIQDECPDQLLRCDTDRVLQVFSNLLGNAIKFTPAGGVVRLRARRLADSVLFSVQDTGAGIAPEDLPRIFDRLWQARPTARAGIGFGLFISRAIIEAHGGAICPESVPGTGSTFFFTLPLESVARRPRAA